MSVPFLLTEIALELLGNKFYNINGEQCPNLKDLFNPSNSVIPSTFQINESNLISQLGLDEINLFGVNNKKQKPNNKNNSGDDDDSDVHQTNNNKHCIEYLDNQLMKIINSDQKEQKLKKETSKIKVDKGSSETESKRLKLTTDHRNSFESSCIRDSIDKERVKILLASENEKQMLFTSSTSAIEKTQFNHVEKMRLLCEANDIIKSIKLVLDSIETDPATKKAKIDSILKLREQIFE
uniref:CSON013303 protein n=1 Tax=Culicoides sonorensis TaxID=179676 RepID=A0A336KYC6_CULSO